MKNFKPTTAASVLVLSLAGCGGAGDGNPNTTAVNSEQGESRQGSISAPLNAPPATFETAEYQRSRATAENGASTFYAAGADGSGVTVAVLDTGIDTDHPELQGRIHGASKSLHAGTYAGVEDVYGHGTKVAGAIAANRDGQGMQGVAPGAKILALRVDEDHKCDVPTNCSFSQSNLATGTDHAVANGAKVLNYSLSAQSGIGADFAAALRRAADAGAIAVMAAGNKGQADPHWPGAYATDPGMKGRAIVVGAVDGNNNIAAFSNRAGTAKDAYLVAPGTSVYTSSVGGGYASANGTSLATPIVSGAVALIVDLAPHLKPEQVVALLFETAEDLGAVGVDDVYGHGLLDLEAALSPQGATVVALGDTVAGGGAGLDATAANFGAGVGDVAQVVRALAGAVAFDELGRRYDAQLGLRVSQTERRSRVMNWLQAEHPEVARLAEGPIGLAFAREAEGDTRYGREDGQVRAMLGETDLGSSTKLRVGFDQQPVNMASGQGGAGVPGALPHLGLVGGGGLGLEQALSGGWSFEVGYVDDRLGDDEHGRSGVGLSLAKAGDRGGMRFALGQVLEEQGPLGSIAEGAFANLGGAKTTVAGFDATRWLSSNVRAFAGAGVGWTAGRDAENGLVRGTDAFLSLGYGAGVAIDDAFAAADALTLSISQPLRAENGRVQLSVPTGRTLDGAVTREDRSASLSPSGREVAIDAGYGLALDHASRVDLKAQLRLQPDHDATAAPEAALGLRYSLSF